MKKTLFAAALSVLMFGCVTTSMLKLDPLTLDGQKNSTKDGLNAITSGKNVQVTIRPATDMYSSEDRPRLVVSVSSTSGEFPFSPGNIQVFVDGNPHRVFTYDELVTEMKAKEKAEKDKAEKVKNAQFMSGQNASVSNNQYTSTLNKIEKETVESLKMLDDTALKNVSALPGQEISGQVTIEKVADPSKTHEVKVIVRVNNETHEFLLNQVVVTK